MLEFGRKVLKARQARGLTQSELADLCSNFRPTVVSTIGSIEARAKGANADHADISNRAETGLIWALSKALSIPAIYFLTPDFRDYVRDRYHCLTGEERQEFSNRKIAGRIAWVIHDLQRFWGAEGGFDLAKVVAQVPCLTMEDLQLFLASDLALSGNQLNALCDALSLPKEALQDERQAIVMDQQIEAYVPVMETVARLNISPHELAFHVLQLIGKQPKPMDKGNSHP